MFTWKKCVLFSLLSAYLLQAESTLAYTSGLGGTAGGMGSGHLEGMKPLGPVPTKPQAKTPSTTATHLPPVAPPPSVPQMATYLHPGILVLRGAGWEGGDNLFNLSKNIGVYVTIVKPENDPLAVTEEGLYTQISEIFKKGDITPVTLAPLGKPPLPAFEVQVLAYPITGGYVVACEGRLFESVDPQRFRLDSNMAFQAVTWEKKSLQVGPTNKIAEQIHGCVADIAGTFVERFVIFERHKHESSR